MKSILLFYLLNHFFHSISANEVIKKFLNDVHGNQDLYKCCLDTLAVACKDKLMVEAAGRTDDKYVIYIKKQRYEFNLNAAKTWRLLIENGTDQEKEVKAAFNFNNAFYVVIENKIYDGSNKPATVKKYDEAIKSIDKTKILDIMDAGTDVYVFYSTNKPKYKITGKDEEYDGQLIAVGVTEVNAFFNGYYFTSEATVCPFGIQSDNQPKKNGFLGLEFLQSTWKHLPLCTPVQTVLGCPQAMCFKMEFDDFITKYKEQDMESVHGFRNAYHYKHGQGIGSLDFPKSNESQSVHEYMKPFFKEANVDEDKAFKYIDGGFLYIDNFGLIFSGDQVYFKAYTSQLQKEKDDGKGGPVHVVENWRSGSGQFHKYFELPGDLRKSYIDAVFYSGNGLLDQSSNAQGNQIVKVTRVTNGHLYIFFGDQVFVLDCKNQGASKCGDPRKQGIETLFKGISRVDAVMTRKHGKSAASRFPNFELTVLSGNFYYRYDMKEYDDDTKLSDRLGADKVEPKLIWNLFKDAETICSKALFDESKKRVYYKKSPEEDATTSTRRVWYKDNTILVIIVCIVIGLGIIAVIVLLIYGPRKETIVIEGGVKYIYIKKKKVKYDDYKSSLAVGSKRSTLGSNILGDDDKPKGKPKHKAKGSNIKSAASGIKSSTSGVKKGSSVKSPGSGIKSSASGIKSSTSRE